jgi:hypothetical protein
VIEDPLDHYSINYKLRGNSKTPIRYSMPINTNKNVEKAAVENLATRIEAYLIHKMKILNIASLKTLMDDAN